MDGLIGAAVPLILLTVSLAALRKHENVYALMTDGASLGIRTVFRILPPLIVLLSAVSMLRASGAAEALTGLLRPFAKVLGIPPETLPLLLIRPLSGSAALAVGSELMASYGVDSPVGRTAAVMLGSTETTFYIISVYFGAAGIRKTRYAIPAALLADLTGFVTAAWSVRLFMK